MICENILKQKYRGNEISMSHIAANSISPDVALYGLFEKFP